MTPRARRQLRNLLIDVVVFTALIVGVFIGLGFYTGLIE